MTKLVIDVSGQGITGYRAAEELHSMGIESIAGASILCIMTVSDTKDDMDRLVSGLNALSGKYSLSGIQICTALRD